MNEAMAYIWGLPLVCHLAVVLLILPAALLLLLPTVTRTAGKRIVFALIGTVPVVWGFQLLTLPLVVGLAALSMPISALSDTAGGFCLGVAWVGVVAANVVGFLVGWRVGWRLGIGLPVKAVIATDPILGRIVPRLVRGGRSIARCLGYPDR